MKSVKLSSQCGASLLFAMANAKHFAVLGLEYPLIDDLLSVNNNRRTWCDDKFLTLPDDFLANHANSTPFYALKMADLKMMVSTVHTQHIALAEIYTDNSDYDTPTNVLITQNPMQLADMKNDIKRCLAGVLNIRTADDVAKRIATIQSEHLGGRFDYGSTLYLNKSHFNVENQDKNGEFVDVVHYPWCASMEMYVGFHYNDFLKGRIPVRVIYKLEGRLSAITTHVEVDTTLNELIHVINT